MRILLGRAKAYKSELLAVRRAEKALAQYTDIRWLIVEGPNGFVPVVFLTGEQTVYARQFADAGIFVIA